MFRHVRGVPRSPINQMTWWVDSAASIQKSHCMSLERRFVSGRDAGIGGRLTDPRA